MSGFNTAVNTGQLSSNELNGSMINDVKCAPRSGINVLIVGAGVGGLVAAMECHRKGHNVRIFERSHSASAGGDMFTIGLSARRMFKHYPSMNKEFDEISIHDGRMQYFKWSSEPIGPAQPFAHFMDGHTEALDEMPMVTQLRPLYHAMLHHQVQRFGIEVQYGKRVVEYFEDPELGVGGVVTDSGERAEADLVIAADGLHSHSQDIVLSGQNKGKPSGRSVFRAAMDLETVTKDPMVAKQFGLFEGTKPIMQGWMGPDTHAMTLSYVNKHGQNGRLLWGMSFREHGEQGTTESWHNTVSNQDVLKVLEETSGWGEPMKRLVKAMPEGSIVYWPLIWRTPNPCWHSKACRVLQIGDAAHTFLPTSGNGASQAIEDAITIATCLAHASKDDVPLAVAVHNKLRFDRVSCAQRLGFYNAERFQKTDLNKVAGDPSKVQAKVPRWIYSLDPEEYAENNYGKAAASLIEGGPEFKNTNIPPGHVPTPWSLEEVEKLEAEGKNIELTGDWS